MAHALQRLLIGDDPAAWSAAGFDVHGNTVVMGKTLIELTGGGDARGIVGWALDGVTTDIDGLPTVIVPEHRRPDPVTHPNQVFAIDHVVVASDNPARTSAAFASTGMEERKLIELNGPDGALRQQRFFWAGRVIVELMGPAEPSSDNPATFWGLALVSANLEIASTQMGDLLSEPRDAVQPGRKIATVRTRELDISVPIALMSPHVANLGEPEPAN